MAFELRKENPATARRPTSADRVSILVDQNGNPLKMDHNGSTSALAQFNGEPVASDIQVADPTEIIGVRGWRYSKDVSGIVESFYLDDQGQVVQMTSNGVVAGLGGVPLATDKQASDPTPVAGTRGWYYSKLINGVVEAFYISDTGQVTQLTKNGSPAGYADTFLQDTAETDDETPEIILTYSTLANDRVIDLKARVFCIEPATGDVGKWVIEATGYRDGSSVVTIEDENVLYEHKDQLAWDAGLVVSSQDIQAGGIGESGKTIEWRVQLEVNEHG